jgi:hypothetical protein
VLTTRDERCSEWTIAEAIPLALGERAYGNIQAIGWRYCGVDAVGYERRTVLAGGPFLMALKAIASAVGNHRRRAEAQRLAEPQWRSLGTLQIVVTSHRLLVWHQGAWSSVWLAAITNGRLDAAQATLDLFFEADPPYRLAGEGVTDLAVFLDAVLSQRSTVRDHVRVAAG